MGINVSLGYYIPLFRSNFFYAPEIALREKNLILSLILESGEYVQAGIGLGVLF